MAETMIPLGNKPFVTPYASVGREVCKNLYLEYSGSATAKAEYYAIRIPGMNIASVWKAGESRARGLHTGTDGNLYIVQRNRFARIDAEGHGTQLGTINTISTAPVSMCDNGSELLIVDGQDGWIYKFVDNSFTHITDDAFPGVVSGIGPTHCVCIDGYFLINDPGTTNYQWSQPYYVPEGDGTLWNGLDFGKKQSTPEPITALASCMGLLWLFGERSIEVHYNTGDFANGVWQRQQGAIMQMGLVAPRAVATFASSVFWLGSDQTGAVGVWTNDGFTPRRISTRGVEQIFQTLGDLSSTVGFVYSHNGHTFYVLQLPGRCFVYDATTDAWHERTYLSPLTGAESSWRGWLHAFAYGRNIVGQIDGGGLCWIDQDAHRNRDPLNFTYDYIRWEKTSPITFSNGRFVAYAWAQPIFQQGVGLAVALDPVTGGPASYLKTGLITDGGKAYRVGLMPDGKWWSLDNFAEGGRYYANNSANVQYGKLYNTGEFVYNTSPNGTRSPRAADWDGLVSAAGGATALVSSLDGGSDRYGFGLRLGGGFNGFAWSGLGVNGAYWGGGDNPFFDPYPVRIFTDSGVTSSTFPPSSAFAYSRFIVSDESLIAVNPAPTFGQDPVCRLSWSNDSGSSYGNEHALPMGKMGEYGRRSRKWICGHGRNRVWKITGSDPVPTILVALLVDAEVMAS